MCLYPKLYRNPKYKKNQKNGGNIPPVSDKRVLLVPIGCGKCIECMKQKAREWQVRLTEDIKINREALFVTLTFNTKSIIELSKYFPDLKGYALDNAIATLAVRRFLERWRKKYGVSLRHFLITELGTKNYEHIHLHGILYTKNREDIRKIWAYGYTWTGYSKNEQIVNYVNAETVNYITKYIQKQDTKHKYYKPIILCSKGIGSNYISKKTRDTHQYNGSDTKEYYRTDGGYKLGLPIYYRNKLFTDEQREKLWLNKLDEQTRYVLGQKIDISKGTELYYKTLDQARKLNKQLGYMSDEVNWVHEEYENKRRTLIIEKRIEEYKNKENNNNKKNKETHP